MGPYKNRHNAEVYKMALLKKYRFKGLWTYLASNAYLFLKSQKVHNVFITVQKDQKDLHRFYTSLGFTSIEMSIHPLRGELILMKADLQSKNLKIIANKYEKHLSKGTGNFIKDKTILKI